MYGGLSQGWIVECFVCLRVDGASTFQGVRFLKYYPNGD